MYVSVHMCVHTMYILCDYVQCYEDTTGAELHHIDKIFFSKILCTIHSVSL